MGKNVTLFPPAAYQREKICLTLAAYFLCLENPGLPACYLLIPMDFPGKNTRVGFHFLLQGIFHIQRSNSCLLHWQVDSLPLNHLGSPYQGARFVSNLE